jgi:SWI/SNF-related matrix-associated actin-dependent regulator of chromatin subfamily A3
MSKLRSALHSSNVRLVGSYFVFSLAWNDPRIVLKLPDGETFATLNENVTLALQDYLANQCVILEALTHTKDLYDAIGTACKPNNDHSTVNLNIYGPLKDASRIGAALSIRKVYLQRPDWYEHGTIYDNPHVLKLPDRTSCQTDYIDIPSCRENKDQSLHAAVDDIYSSLTRSANLRRREGDSRLRTKLLP